MTPHYDKFGNAWPTGPGYENEYCETCGQPDNCGDCTHGKLSVKDVAELGGARAIATYDEDGYTMHLHANGDFVVTHPTVGVMDYGTASMSPEVEDIGTYMDAWLEELRSIVAAYKVHG